MMQTCKLALLTAVLLGANVSVLPADDWPMLGRDNTRNAVSLEKNPPTFWQVEGAPTRYENRRPIEWATESKNVRWKAELGVNTFSTPVVADGLVWIGTTHKDPHVKRAGLLKCFRERDGKLLYEYESPMHEDAVDVWTRTPWLGISSTPLVEGDRLWFTSLGAELVCLDIAPLKRGEGEPTMVWKRDMRKEWGVYPFANSMGPGSTGNVAVHGHLCYAITGNGSQDGLPPAPEAPSLVCLDKRTGELIWQDSRSCDSAVTVHVEERGSRKHGTLGRRPPSSLERLRWRCSHDWDILGGISHQRVPCSCLRIRPLSTIHSNPIGTTF